MTCDVCHGSGMMPGYMPSKKPVTCDFCGGFGEPRSVVQRCWAALDACRTPETRRTVAEAIETVVNELQRLDRRSPAVWTLMTILDGERPVSDEQRLSARSGRQRQVADLTPPTTVIRDRVRKQEMGEGVR